MEMKHAKRRTSASHTMRLFYYLLTNDTFNLPVTMITATDTFNWPSLSQQTVVCLHDKSVAAHVSQQSLLLDQSCADWSIMSSQAWPWKRTASHTRTAHASLLKSLFNTWCLRFDYLTLVTGGGGPSTGVTRTLPQKRYIRGKPPPPKKKFSNIWPNLNAHKEQSTSWEESSPASKEIAQILLSPNICSRIHKSPPLLLTLSQI
jgi:hypothetical protein